MFARLSSVTLLIAFSGFLTFSGCEKPEPQIVVEYPTTLTVLTPHNPDIRHEFNREFTKWYQKEYDKSVSIQWVTRGTPECVNMIDDIHTKATEAAPRVKPDVMFGGGVPDHDEIAKRGYARRVSLDIADGVIPDAIAGQQTKNPDGFWYGVALSSFGIAHNKQACADRNITPPQTWADLADPRFFGWIGIADPTRSGSHKQCMLLVLDSLGWRDGWSTIVRTLGNTRAIQTSSSDVLRQVASGMVLGSYSVNFDAMTLADETDGRVGYINPPDATAASVDCISVLKCGRQPEIARDFVKFVLSDLGQSLWGVDPDHLGTFGRPLFHYPLSRKTYESFTGHMLFSENPLVEDFGLTIDPTKAQQRLRVIAPMVRAATGRNHILLQRAWQAVIENGMPQAALTELTTLPIDEPEAIAAAEALINAPDGDVDELVKEWSALFRAKYERVLGMMAQ